MAFYCEGGSRHGYTVDIFDQDEKEALVLPPLYPEGDGKLLAGKWERYVKAAHTRDGMTVYTFEKDVHSPF